MRRFQALILWMAGGGSAWPAIIIGLALGTGAAFSAADSPSGIPEILRLGVVGDSLSVELRPSWNHPTPPPINWIGLLATTGRVDFGAKQPNAAGCSATGQAHVWGRSGCASGQALHEGFVEAAASALAAGAVDGVAVFIGHDDFFSLLKRKLDHQPVEDAQASAMVEEFAGNYGRILDRLELARPGATVVLTLAPWQFTPFIGQLGLTREEFHLVVDATRRINERIRSAARRRDLTCVEVDRRLAQLFDGRPVRIGGILIETVGAGHEPCFFFRQDGMHPGTVGAMFLANETIAGVNRAFARSIPPFTDAETAGLAGLAVPPTITRKEPTP